MFENPPMTAMHDAAAMIDIETFGTREDAVIASIAAVIFNPKTLESPADLRAPNRCYSAVIDLCAPTSTPRSMDPAVVLWWMRQSKAAQDALLDARSMALTAALTGLRVFLHKHNPRPTRIWAKSPDFDCRILANAYNAELNVQPPWGYYETRCVRTIIEAAFDEEPVWNLDGLTAHDAVDDCIKQILQVQAAFQVLNH